MLTFRSSIYNVFEFYGAAKLTIVTIFVVPFSKIVADGKCVI